MCRPFRRYCFHLGTKLGKSLDEVMSLSSAEISEWMAFDQTNDETWFKNYEKELELERQRSAGTAFKKSLFQQLLGG